MVIHSTYMLRRENQTNKLKYSIFINILITLTLLISGCSQNKTKTISSPTITPTSTPTPVAKNLPSVVVTTTVLCNLTKQIAKDTVNLSCLISPSTDPTKYESKPEDTKAIEEAKLILYNGYNLENKLISVIKTSKNKAPKVSVGELAVPKPLLSKVQNKTVKNKAIPDPYVWHDASNAIKIIDVISDSLGKAIPENITIYSSNTIKLKNEIIQLDKWIKQRIETIPEEKRLLVTTHDEMGYYIKAYGIKYNAALAVVNLEDKPTEKNIEQLAKNLKKSKPITIFPESNINPQLIAAAAKKAEVRVSERQLFTNNLGKAGSGGDSYQKMMTANTRTIVEGLDGTYLIFSPQP
jgi:manganese/iron transport system substrate-binding protein